VSAVSGFEGAGRAPEIFGVALCFLDYAAIIVASVLTVKAFVGTIVRMRMVGVVA
jgi:hypothetical protein